MPKGLLVDFGGVLTTSVLDAFAVFARDEGIDPEKLAGAMRSIMGRPDNLFTRVERGDIDTDEFEAGFVLLIADACGVTLASAGLKSRLFAGASPDEAMLAALRAARAGDAKTGLISNSWGVTGGGYPVDAFAELFDSTVISGEVKMRKPQPEIYLLAAERIGCTPADCVFVDDFKVNVEGAEAVGMTGVHHRDTGETLDRLEAFLGLPLRDRR